MRFGKKYWKCFVMNGKNAHQDDVKKAYGRSETKND